MSSLYLIDEILSDLSLSSGNSRGVNSTKTFIDTMLHFKQENQKQELLRQYRAIYLDNYNKEPVKHKKANAGEYMANVWLRELIGG